MMHVHVCLLNIISVQAASKLAAAETLTHH